MATAQNQHYVPKFILRNFLSNEAKEQVSVYDKHRNLGFTTQIKNIMAERRFNDFKFEYAIATFEQAACNLEDMVLPFYTSILKNRRLSGDSNEKLGLGIFVAFQFLRTKFSREQHASEVVPENWTGR